MNGQSRVDEQPNIKISAYWRCFDTTERDRLVIHSASGLALYPYTKTPCAWLIFIPPFIGDFKYVIVAIKYQYCLLLKYDRICDIPMRNWKLGLKIELCSMFMHNTGIDDLDLIVSVNHTQNNSLRFILLALEMQREYWTHWIVVQYARRSLNSMFQMQHTSM